MRHERESKSFDKGHGEALNNKRSNQATPSNAESHSDAREVRKSTPEIKEEMIGRYKVARFILQRAAFLLNIVFILYTLSHFIISEATLQVVDHFIYFSPLATLVLMAVDYCFAACWWHILLYANLYLYPALSWLLLLLPVSQSLTIEVTVVLVAVCQTITFGTITYFNWKHAKKCNCIPAPKMGG